MAKKWRLQIFPVSHVVLSDPTSACGGEEGVGGGQGIKRAELVGKQCGKWKKN